MADIGACFLQKRGAAAVVLSPVSAGQASARGKQLQWNSGIHAAVICPVLNMGPLLFRTWKV